MSDSFNKFPEFSDVLVLYHAECFDGRMSAWAIYDALTRNISNRNHIEQDNVVQLIGGQITFQAISYDDELPDFTGKDVYMVDFSCDIEDLVKVSKTARTVTVIDHHATLRDKVTAYQKLHPKTQFRQQVNNQAGLPEAFVWSDGGKVEVYFNNKNSGAMLTWRFFNQQAGSMLSIDGSYDKWAPTMIRYAQDYDLFAKKFDESRAIASAMYDKIHDWSFFELSEVIRKAEEWNPENGLQPKGFVRELYDTGLIIFAHQKTLAKGVIKRGMSFHPIEVNDRVLMIPVCQAPRELRTLVGELLANEHPFSITYEDYPSRGIREYSFRSNKKVEGWVDVKEFAERFDGGGHENAAGTRMEHHHNAYRLLEVY